MAGRKPGHGTDDTADSHGRLGIDCAVTHREITSRDDTGRGGDGWPRRGADAGRGGSHGPDGQTAFSEPRRPPYDARGRDSLSLSRAT